MLITVNEVDAAERRVPFLAVQASANSFQLVDLNDIATGDSFTLTYSGQTTASIAFNSFTASDGSALITSSLEALSNIAAGEVQVFRIGSTQEYAVGFGGTFIGTSVALLTATPTGFTMGTITGGVSDSPIVGVGASWPVADIRISKAGVAQAQGTGTTEEVVDGIYDYIFATGEVNTLGRLVGSVRTFGVSVHPFSAQVVAAADGGTILDTGLAQAATSNTITLASTASDTSDYYAPSLLEIVAGTGAFQHGVMIIAYNGTSKVATVSPPFTETPSTDSEYKIRPIAAAPIDDIADAVRAEILADATPFNGADIADIESRTLSAVSLAKLERHTGAVLVAVMGAGSSTTSIILDTVDDLAPSSKVDAYKYASLTFVTGDLKGQRRAINAYNGSTTLTTVAFSDAPTAGDIAVIV